MIINKNQKVYIYLFWFFSLILSFIFGENSSGGSKLDYEITRQFIDAFSVNLTYGIKYFISSGQVQSPFFYFLLSLSEKLLDIIYLKFTYSVVSSFIPLILYICLKKKFQNVNKNYLFLISLIIFLSPYFRSSASWMTTDNFAILFLILSISKYFSLEKKKNLKNLILCSVYLVTATYIRQYYAIFFLLYLILSYKILTKKEIIFLIFFISILFLPLIFYYYNFFLSKSGSSFGNFTDLSSFNLLYIFIVFSSLYFFYFLPFYFNKKGIVKILKLAGKNISTLYVLLISILYLSITIIDPISPREYGGGIFMKISQIFSNNLFIYLASYLGFLVMILNFNKNNFYVYFCLVLMSPFVTVYQKYYDPLLLLVILTLTKNDFFQKIFEEYKCNLKLIYIYYLFFLILINVNYSL